MIFLILVGRVRNSDLTKYESGDYIENQKVVEYVIEFLNISGAPGFGQRFVGGGVSRIC